MACQFCSRIWRFQTSFTFFLCTFECICFLWGHLCWPSSISVVAENNWNISIWWATGLFFKSPETFQAYFGCYNSLDTSSMPKLKAMKLWVLLVFLTWKTGSKFSFSRLQFENLLLAPKKVDGTLEKQTPDLMSTVPLWNHDFLLVNSVLAFSVSNQ